MRPISSWLLRGFAAISLLALPACVEGTTAAATATSPSEAAGPPATAVAPGGPASPVVTVPATPPVAATTATPPASPTASATGAQPGAPLPITAPAVTLITLDGTWESASCGSRTYARRITFAEAAKFIAEELVSPCPKGVSCVWSGIIIRQGTYKVEQDTIALTVGKTSSGPAKTQLPTSLALDGSRAPVEAGDDGKPCVYKRTTGTRKP